MTFETRQAYTEVCEVLQYMPDEYVKKIPEKLVKLFQNGKLDSYKVKIDESNPLDKSCLSKEAIVIIAILNYQYWCPNAKIKNNLYQMYLSNNEKYQKEIREKYNPDNLFKKKEKDKKPSESIEELSMVEYKKQSFLQKILGKIAKFFKR